MNNNLKKKSIQKLMRLSLFICMVAVFVVLAVVSISKDTPVLAKTSEEKTSDSTESSIEKLTEDTDRSDKGKTVRVGWFESKFNQTDQFGRKSGYSYEYQRKIAAYTGWEYEYVEGSWTDLLEMLKNGEIDLLGDVSYVEDRTKYISYPSMPMGTEVYYVFVSPENKEINPEKTSSLNGKKVGVDKNSIQKGMFNEWTEIHKVDVDLIDVTASQSEVLEMLKNGELDAYVTLDSFGNPESVEPLWKIGSSDYYFAVNKDRDDLLEELDNALNKIQNENINYEEYLIEKYFRTNGTNHYLSTEELAWLEEHKKIRIGYQDNYLAFCAKNPDTGELEGALKYYINYASTGLENAELEFEPVCYPTASDAIEAMKNGEVDCVFPANLTDYDGEEMDLVLTPSLMTTEMDAVVRSSEQMEFIDKTDVTVAVNRGNPNYEIFLEENFPGWKIEYFDSTSEGLEGVAAGKADCLIISNYRFNNISKQCDKLHLSTVFTGVELDYCIAVNENDSVLYSILSKTTYLVPESVTNAALTYYSVEAVKLSILDVIKDNLVTILLFGILVVLIILLMLIRSIRFQRTAIKEHHKVEGLNKKVFVDALTNVRNKGAFDEYIQKLQKEIDETGEANFAIGMLDCDNLKKINDKYGHDKGDIYLKGAAQLICHCFRHSSVFRIGGDEFVVIIENEDFRSMEGMIKSFYRRKKEICELAENEWDEVNISIGVAIYDPELDETLEDTMRRADKIMYDNKRVWKRANNMEYR